MWVQSEYLGRRGDLEAYIVGIIFLVFLAILWHRSFGSNADTSFPTDSQPSEPLLRRSSDLSIFPEQFVVVDLETTGLDEDRDEIIEIGAIRVNLATDSKDTFQALIKPRMDVPEFITKLTGITQGMVDRDGRPLFDVLSEFTGFIGNLPLVTFNASFDMGFLQSAASKHGIHISNQYTCALRMARKAWPNLSSHRLVDIAKWGKLSTDDSHRALGDCGRALSVFLAAGKTTGEAISLKTPAVHWRLMADYHKRRSANRAFCDVTRPLEATDLPLASTRYFEALSRMYEYEKIANSEWGDDHILDRLTLCLFKLSRYRELVTSVDGYAERFPRHQSSLMLAILKRRARAADKLKLQNPVTSAMPGSVQGFHGERAAARKQPLGDV